MTRDNDVDVATEDYAVALMSRTPFDFLPAEIDYLLEKHGAKLVLAKAQRVEADYVSGRITGSARRYLEVVLEGNRKRGAGAPKREPTHRVAADLLRSDLVARLGTDGAERYEHEKAMAEHVASSAVEEGDAAYHDRLTRLWQRCHSAPLSELRDWRNA